MRRWRPALRVAWRDALRTRGRSLLVVAMIGLPVAGVTAADVLIRTQDVSTLEGLEQRLGAADARVDVSGRRPLAQPPDPSAGFATLGRRGDRLPPPTPARVAAAIGDGARAIRVLDQPLEVRTREGIASVEARELDLRDPMTRGLYPLQSGRYARSGDEVVVSGALAARGIGDRLTPLEGAPSTVVGVVRLPERLDELMVVGPPGGLGLNPDKGLGGYLVAKPGGVSWDDVRAANRQGLTVLSRRVVEDPPPASDVDPRVAGLGGVDGDMAAFVALVAVMALLEVALLAGPAFAVGTRQKAQTLALMTAGGGAAPADLRRTVLASGVVLGTAGALTGAAVGVGAAVLLEPVLQARSSQRFGPFEVAPFDLLGVIGFGVLSAVLAAVVPAWLASRQDVVATLGGRRGDPPPSRRSPLVGLLLLALGIAGAVSGAGQLSGETRIAIATVVAVVGVVLLLPTIVAGLGRAAGALPLPMRFAVRDAARHRNRTAPAVAAIMATVVGVTALSITSSSDEREREGTYTASAPPGAALITGGPFLPGGGRTSAPLPWSRAEAAAQRVLPGATVRAIRGPGLRSELRFSGIGSNFNSSLGTFTPVVSGDVGGLGLPIAAADIARADAVLARGGAVVFTDRRADERETTITGAERRVTVPAAYVDYTSTYAPNAGLLSPSAARRAGVAAETRALLVSGTRIGPSAEQDLVEAVRGTSSRFSAYVERGYDADGGEQLLVLAVLAGVAALLMLGGSLTASALALSDARPDLATLAAVGAPPRTRRLIAAAYAGALGLIGALVGVAVGLVPGIAAAYSMTSNPFGAGGVPGARVPDSFVHVPWPLLAGIVIGLPLLTALVAALTSRSRLPTVARLT